MPEPGLVALFGGVLLVMVVVALWARSALQPDPDRPPLCMQEHPTHTGATEHVREWLRERVGGGR